MSFRRIVFICVVVVLTPLQAWQIQAWNALKAGAGELAREVLVSLFVSELTSGEVDDLADKVDSLESQLQQYKKGSKPTDYVEIEELILSLKTVVVNFNQRVSSLEERVNHLEKRLNLTVKNTSIITRQVSKNYSNRVLKQIKPSFRCSRATKAIEHSICGSFVLRDIDGRMGRIYRELRKKTSYSKKLKREQLKWLRKRDNECTPYDEECLVAVYQDRIYELKRKVK